MPSTRKSKKAKAPHIIGVVQPNYRTKVAATEGNNIRNWRLFRGIETQKELAALTIPHDPRGKGVLREAICRLEKGDARYNEDQIKLLAAALKTTPRDLIGTNPFDAGDVFALYAGLSDADKERAKRYIKKLR